MAFRKSRVDDPAPCERGVQSSETKLSDAQVQKLRADSPGITPACLEKIRLGGIEAMPDRTDQCFEMAPAKRWSGLWADNFEARRFCPTPARECGSQTPRPAIWLSFAPGVRRDSIPTNRVYTIEFVGRRTLQQGSYGHMGMSEHEIIVDRIISISPLVAGAQPQPR